MSLAQRGARTSQLHTLSSTTPDDERYAVFRGYGLLDTPTEYAFDDLTDLAAQLCETPVAVVSLVEAGRRWFERHLDTRICSTSLADSFCRYATDRSAVMVVQDTASDPRFAGSGLVTGDPGIRFYAGAPLITDDGKVLGTLCVIDTVPRDLADQLQQQLAVLAGQVMAQLELRRHVRELAHSSAARDASNLALANSQHLLEGILASTDAIVYAKDLDGRFVIANPALHELLGVPDGQALGRSNWDLFPQLAADEFHRNDVAVAARGVREVFAEQLLHADGTVHDYQSTKFPLFDESGTVYAVGGVSTDVTGLAEHSREQGAAETALRESERRWKSLIAGSPVGIGLSDENGHFIAANAALCTLLGRSERELEGKSSREFTHPDDLDSHRAAHSKIEGADDGVVRVEKRYIRPSGEIRWAWLTVAHTSGPHGETWTLAHVQDVTERKAAEQAVADSEANLSVVADMVKEIQLGADARQVFVDSALLLSHASVAMLLEPSPFDASLRVAATTRPAFAGMTISLDATSISVEAFATGRAVFAGNTDGHPMVPAASRDAIGAESLYAVPVRAGDVVTGVLLVGWDQRIDDEADRRVAVSSVLADQSGVALRQATLFAELESIALNDPLTGLPNRRGWDQHLNLMLALARRSGKPLTIALADLDHFKQFNDAYGHLVGDALLRQFATNGRSALREGDTVARWGGEEFALALPDCPSYEATRVLDRIAAAVPQGQTCSIGFATWDGTESAEALMTRADRALYAAKRTGRNRVIHG